MIRKFSILLLFTIFFCSTIKSQDSQQGFEFLPNGLHFLPLKANIQEARLGVVYFPENGNLKVDVGNSSDLIQFNFYSIDARLTIGIEFFAYAWATSYNGNRLQINALDGFFGGNAAFSKDYKDSKFISRFRIIHNSAHLVDGHWDEGEWIGGIKPIPYTRDFGELTLGYRIYSSFGSFMGYGAVSYSTLVRPSDMKKWTGFAGFELVFNNLIGQIFRKESNLYLTYQMGAASTPNYTVDNHLMVGIKLGDWEKKGVALYLSYYDGRNYFSEFFTEQINKFGIGFQVDFY